MELNKTVTCRHSPLGTDHIQIVALGLVIVFLLSLVPAADIGGYAGGFLRVGTTARSLAMGGGMTAVIDKGFVAYHNPASLGFLQRRYVSVFHHFLPLDRYLASATFASSLPPTGGLGLALVKAGVNEIDGRDRSGLHIETMSAAEYAVYFGFANELVEGISVGVNVKLIYQMLPVGGEGKSRGTGFDIGVMIRRFKEFDLGLVIQDMNTAFNWNTSGIFENKGRTYVDKFPLQIRLGLAYHFQYLDLVGDYSFIAAEKYVTAHRVRAGGEYRPLNQVAIRAGMDNFMPTVGVGLNYSLLKRDDAYVDYAFLLGRRGEGIAHVFTYVFSF